MTTAVIHHDDCFRHEPGPNHPERPERLKAVMSGLVGLEGIERLPAPLATAAQVCRVHDGRWFREIEELEPADGIVALDADTMLGPGSLNASLRGSGGACFAVDQLMAGMALNAFCATRPPGHHAETSRAMGFCFFNHVAVAARHAQIEHGLGRVSILDFDVHHGNGTQEIFFDSETVQYISSHQAPLYPGTGLADETGRGNVLNMPLDAGTDGTGFREAWSSLGLPALHAFEPELVLISAGFDAHRADPLAQLELEASDFGWITREICDFAADACSGRVVSVLEGGYDLDALTECAHAHVGELIKIA